jgi:hypothetical protein
VAPAPNVGPIVHQSYPLRQPEEDANEILVSVRGRVLRRTRRQLSSLAANRFPWPESLLGAATLCLGGFLGALGSSLPWAFVKDNVGLPTGRAILFYVILPVLGAAALVAFFCIRHFGSQSASDIARAILDELPDPERTL